MKLRVIVEVVDEKTCKGTRRRREVKIPDSVLNIHKVLCESRKDLRALVADDVISAAIKTVSSSQNTTEAMQQAFLSEPSPTPNSVQEQTSSQHSKKRTHNKIDSFLGLDVIEHMDGIDSVVASHQPKSQPPVINGMVWGPVGFGPDRGK